MLLIYSAHKIRCNVELDVHSVASYRAVSFKYGSERA